jgi:alpha-tubulin suppressor-like RCC1 family protein
MLHAALFRLRGLRNGSHRAVALTIAALIPLLATCSDGSPTQPEDPNSIEAQIKALFPPGASTQDAALAQIADIRQQVALSATAQARSKTLTLVDFTMTSFSDGKLVGGTSATAGNAASRLVNSLYQLVGMDPPNLPDGALSNDGAAKVVGPEGAVIVTPSGTAGVQIPAGAVDQSVLVTVTRLATPPTPGTGPLPTTLKQYPPYYDFSTFPAIAQFGDSARVGVCQVTDPASPLYPPEPHDRLRLAHTVGGTIQILDRVGVNDFLRCTNVSASIAPSGGWRTALSALARRVIGRVTPVSLYAAHGGLGGKVKSFSPFGAVDGSFTPPQNRMEAGEATVCALNPAGTVYCWGENDRGQYGATLPASTSPVPTAVPTLQEFGVGPRQGFCGITQSRAAVCWGRGGFGEQGGGSPGVFATPPTIVAGGITWAGVSVSRLSGCGVSTTGVGYCWGSNQRGEIGSATIALNTVNSSPVQIEGGLTFRSVVGGWIHACGITTAGDTYCWGDNTSGQLGIGSIDTVSHRSPVRVVGGEQFVQLTLGSRHTCAITIERRAFCWGENATGQLGDGTTTRRGSPTEVASGLRFGYIATGSGFAQGTSTPPPDVGVQAGVAHTCAITEGGVPYCWGWNGAGQLGDGTTTDRLTPTAVVGSLQLTTIGLGGSYTCGMRGNAIWCWGANAVGQLGNGSLVASSTPVLVASPFSSP